METQQIETFIPRYGLDKSTNKSLLPNYLFVRLDTIPYSMRWVKTRNGVYAVLTDGESYAKVPNEIVEIIKDQLNKIDTIDATGFPLYEGNQVEVARGPMRGLREVFGKKLSAKQRILVILEVGRQLRVDIPTSSVRRVL